METKIQSEKTEEEYCWTLPVVGPPSCNISLSSDCLTVQRPGDDSHTRALLRSDCRIQSPGTHTFSVHVSMLPSNHDLDPLEFGILWRSDDDASFHGCGYVSGGSNQGATIMKDGHYCCECPSARVNNLLTLEVTVCYATKLKSVRFMLDHKYISPPISLDDAPLPIVPVITVPRASSISIARRYCISNIVTVESPTQSANKNPAEVEEIANEFEEDITKDVAMEDGPQDWSRTGYVASMATMFFAHHSPSTPPTTSSTIIASEIVHDIVESVLHSATHFSCGPCLVCASRGQHVSVCRGEYGHQSATIPQAMVLLPGSPGRCLIYPNLEAEILRVSPSGDHIIMLPTETVITVKRKDFLVYAMDLIDGSWATSRWVECYKCHKLRNIREEQLVPETQNWECSRLPGLKCGSRPDLLQKITRVSDLKNFVPPDPVELKVALDLNADTIFTLVDGRVVCWIGNRPYAVAHEGERIEQIVSHFKIDIDYVLAINASINASLTPATTLSAGSTLLLPWFERDVDPRHQILLALMRSGWRCNNYTYLPPPDAPVVRVFHDLKSVLYRYPSFLDVLKFVPPDQSGQYLLRHIPAPPKIGKSRGSNFVQSEISHPQRQPQQVPSSRQNRPGPSSTDLTQSQSETLLSKQSPPVMHSLQSHVSQLLGLAFAKSQPKPTSTSEPSSCPSHLASSFSVNPKPPVQSIGSEPSDASQSTTSTSSLSIPKIPQPTSTTSNSPLAPLNPSFEHIPPALWEQLKSAGVVVSDLQTSLIAATQDFTPVERDLPYGRWVVAQSQDGSCHFAKVEKFNDEDDTYDLVQQNGDVLSHHPRASVRNPDVNEVHQPRNTQFGRIQYAQNGKWKGKNLNGDLIPGIFDTVEDAEVALEAYFYAREALALAPAGEKPASVERHPAKRKKSRRSDVRATKRPREHKFASLLTESSSSARMADDTSLAELVAKATATTEKPPQVLANENNVICPICLESAKDSPDPVLRTQCCSNLFHRACLDECVKVNGGRAACPTCRNSTGFHRQLRATRRLERFGDGAEGLTGSEIWRLGSGKMSGKAQVQVAKAQDDTASQGWTCQSCTGINSLDILSCSRCGASRSLYVSPAASHSSGNASPTVTSKPQPTPNPSTSIPPSHRNRVRIKDFEDAQVVDPIHGEGHVVEIVDKGWIVVEKEDGTKFKSRPGRVQFLGESPTEEETASEPHSPTTPTSSRPESHEYVGQTVVHEVYGEGVVLSVNERGWMLIRGSTGQKFKARSKQLALVGSPASRGPKRDSDSHVCASKAMLGAQVEHPDHGTGTVTAIAEKGWMTIIRPDGSMFKARPTTVNIVSEKKSE